MVCCSQLFPTQQLVLADNADGACVVAAVQSRIVCLLPVPLEEQVRHQLRGKRYEEAVALACSAVALNGMPRSWLETVRNSLCTPWVPSLQLAPAANSPHVYPRSVRTLSLRQRGIS